MAASMLCKLFSTWPRPCFQARRCSASSMEHQSLLRCCTAGGLEAPDPNNTRPKLRSKPPVTQDAPAGTGSLPAAAPTERGGRTPASQPLQQRRSAGNSSRPASGAVPAQGGAQASASQAPPRSQQRSSAGTAAVPAGGLGEQGTEALEEQGAQGCERRSRAGAAAVHTARPPQSSERPASACTSAGPAQHLLPATESLPAPQCIASSSGTWCAAYKFIQQQGLASAPRQVSTCGRAHGAGTHISRQAQSEWQTLLPTLCQILSCAGCCQDKSLKRLCCAALQVHGCWLVGPCRQSRQGQAPAIVFWPSWGSPGAAWVAAAWLPLRKPLQLLVSPGQVHGPAHMVLALIHSLAWGSHQEAAGPAVSFGAPLPERNWCELAALLCCMH